VRFLNDYGKLVEIVKRDGPSTTAVIQVKELLGNWLNKHICGIDSKLRTCAGNGHPHRTVAAGNRFDGFRDF
jgi:hemerythrin